MAAADRSLVIGVFLDRSQAQQVIAELKRTGLGDDQMQLIVHDTENVMDNGRTALESLGIPAEEERMYRQELETGRAIVIVSTSKHQQDVRAILQQRGSYNVRLLVVQNQQFENVSAAPSEENASSPIAYDPIKGPIRANSEEQGSVDSSGYGLKRDPNVETDATATPRTYDKEVRPEKPLDAGIERSSFNRPAPETEDPGSPEDPNVRLPRIV